MTDQRQRPQDEPDPGRRAFLARAGTTAGKPIGWARMGRRVARHLGRMLKRSNLSRFLR